MGTTILKIFFCHNWARFTFIIQYLLRRQISAPYRSRKYLYRCNDHNTFSPYSTAGGAVTTATFSAMLSVSGPSGMAVSPSENCMLQVFDRHYNLLQFGWRITRHFLAPGSSGRDRFRFIRERPHIVDTGSGDVCKITGSGIRNRP